MNDAVFQRTLHQVKNKIIFHMFRFEFLRNLSREVISATHEKIKITKKVNEKLFSFVERLLIFRKQINLNLCGSR